MLKLCGLQVEYYLILLIREYLHQRRYLLTQQPSSLFYSYERTASLSCSGPPSIRFGIAFIERASEQPTRTEKYEWSPPSPPPRAYGRVIGIHRSIHPSLPRSAPFTN